MKQLIPICLAGFLGIVLTAVAAAFLSSTNRRAGGDAIMLLPKRRLDLGAVTYREKREFRFCVVNKGNRRLVINEIDSDCGCGEPVRRAVLIPPGEVEQLTVSLDTRFATGEIQKLAEYTTNDPTQPRLELLVTAFVQSADDSRDAELEPHLGVSLLIHR